MLSLGGRGWGSCVGGGGVRVHKPPLMEDLLNVRYEADGRVCTCTHTITDVCVCLSMYVTYCHYTWKRDASM